MITKENLIKVLRASHVSEKSSLVMEKNNVIVFKVAKHATKIDIKDAIQKLFKVKVKNINTLLVKGKTKRYGQRIGYRNDWKKAYVFLRKNQSLDIIGGVE
ncbi:MAG: 50S ribosomal protein L23 [Arsenophonus endosymbiont of Ceratovacuna japonica]